MGSSAILRTHSLSKQGRASRKCRRILERILKHRGFFGPLVSLVVLSVVAVWIVSSPTTTNAINQPILTVASPRVVVLKSARVLHLFDGDALSRSYSIALGSQPDGQKQRIGDGRTPEGVFRICAKKANSEHHRFIGLDYPDVGAVERGLKNGLISAGQASEMFRAIEAGECPNWTSALGGGIGLHGGKMAEPVTAGCVALTDEDIEELFAVLRVGDVVEILP